jgi:hypothetical protein
MRDKAGKSRKPAAAANYFGVVKPISQKPSRKAIRFWEFSYETVFETNR